MIVPVYSINAVLGTVLVETTEISEILAIFRAMYEAVLIVSFFQLIVAYVCYNKEVRINHFILQSKCPRTGVS